MGKNATSCLASSDHAGNGRRIGGKGKQKGILKNNKNE